MLSPQQILDAARSKWPRVLRAEAAGENMFPLAIPFGRPSTTGDFGTIRKKLANLASADYKWRIDWKEIDTRRWGKQRWPRKVSFDSIENLAVALQLTEQLRLFREALAFARSACPKLEPWLQTRGHKIPELFSDWKSLIRVCAYFDANPSPHCFARQLSIPVGTKFIEEHKGILDELLKEVLGDRVNTNGVSFEERFYLRTETPQVRFRFLDEALQDHTGWPVVDCSIYVEDFASMRWNIPRVLIVENKAVFLSLPNTPDTLAILGSGKAAVSLSSCKWIEDSDVVYWGDCDEAGLGILSSMRALFPKMRSIFMDYESWMRWKRFAVAGKRDGTAQYAHLTPAEVETLTAVKEGPWMLEQEKIPHEEVEKMIKIIFPMNQHGSSRLHLSVD
ncbi:MAG: DUF2220 family protein [Acidobacteriaceae bacterium]|nr:DUF2220 family protein [Acidobacteriaceae bacterium]